jgi:MoaA/NifB/PqqE/SkfB family radical SAM enzyme
MLGDNLRLVGALTDRLLTGPATVHMHITGRCNLSCAYCWYHSGRKGEGQRTAPEDMDYTEFRKVADDCRALNVCSVSFAGEGEPFLHPEIGKMIGYVKGKGMRLGILTNGTFGKGMIKHARKADWLRFNLPAATEETYSELQGRDAGEAFESALRNLLYLSKLRRKGVSVPATEISYIINRKNFREIPKIAELASRLKVQKLCFRVMDRTPENRGITLRKKEVAEFRREAKRVTEAGTDVPNNLREIYPIFGNSTFLRHNQNLTHYSGRSGKVQACYNGWYYVLIALNGDVSMCCLNEESVAGNIHKSPFRSIWEGEKFRRMRLDYKYNFNPGKRKWKPCNFCLFSERNSMVHGKLSSFTS